MEVFEACSEINNFLECQDELSARESLIKLLDFLQKEKIEYSSLVNHLIRRSGLYPYLKPEFATWDDRCVFDAFKVNIGNDEPITLHREQSSILKKLINNESLAVSAPTSFGKSFIIDAFIAIKKPNNVAIIVPTLALTDETRRRIQKKFSHTHKIITTGDVELAERNIFIFPQERAIQYSRIIKNLDLLVIDEFYKASPNFDKDRSAALQRTILQLGEIAKQRYFLAPNISSIKENILTKGMEFIIVNFNTVFLEKHDLFNTIGGDFPKKIEFLLNLLNNTTGKTLVYAATYTAIKDISDELIEKKKISNNKLPIDFSQWLEKNYHPDWSLTKLSKKAIGIHNGQLHRSISQIQMKLFDDENGLTTLISTSSIIEGVNTSAENVVIWSNKAGGPGNPKLKDFSYRNIIGRGGRMLRHFIGKIYILELPPPPEKTQLQLTLQDATLGAIDEVKQANYLTAEQIARIISYKDEMREIVGEENLSKILNNNEIQNTDPELIKNIYRQIKENPKEWNGILHLNSDDPKNWERILRKIFFLKPNVFGYSKKVDDVIYFITILTNNWKSSIPKMLDRLKIINIEIDDFFAFERAVTYKFASILNDVCVLHKIVTGNTVDVSPFTTKLSYAFLPPNVFKLEEYGLPRMLSRKIHDAGLINLVDTSIDLHSCIELFVLIGAKKIIANVDGLCDFDKYIIDNFYDGLQTKHSNVALQ